MNDRPQLMMTNIRKMKSPEWCAHFKGKDLYQCTTILAAMPYRDNGIALDIGAHIGHAARIIATHFDHVVCFEPAADLIPFLMHNAPWADVRPIALGATKCRGRINRPKIDNSGSGEVVPGDEFTIMPLDSIDLSKLGFVKIDVQGMELDVLLGGEKTLLRDKPTILCEGGDGCEAETFLRQMGAYICGRLGQDFIAGWNLQCKRGAFKEPL